MIIIIIRALSQWGKDEGDCDSPTSRDETPDEKKRKAKKREGPKKEKKREKGQCYYPFTKLVLQSSTMFFIYRLESLLSYRFHILVGIFIIELGLYIPMMGFLKFPRSSWASKLDAHTLSFQFELSYTYSSSASVAWQSLLLALTSIDGHLHSQLISLVDVRLSPFLSSPHTPHHHILFHP